MKRFKWISRASLFGGLLTYMGASFQGLQLMQAMEKAFLATVVLYGLGIFSIMAYYQITLHMPKPSSEKDSESNSAGMVQSHGTDAASWDGE